MVVGMSTDDLIEAFRAKARCRHSQTRAKALYRELRERIGYRERDLLLVSWGHCFEDYCSPDELDGVCDLLRGRYGN